MSAPDPFILLFASLLVAGLVTWRLLIGSHHEGRHERNAKLKLSHDSERPLHSAALPRAKYEGVSVRVCNHPCDAVKEIRKHVYLVAEAPQLPLPDCDRACNCDFIQHADRRDSKDRRHCGGHDHDIDGTEQLSDQRDSKDRRRGKRHYQGIN